MGIGIKLAVFSLLWAGIFGAAAGMYLLWAYFPAVRRFNRRYALFAKKIRENPMQAVPAASVAAMLRFLRRWRHNPRLRHPALMYAMYWSLFSGNPKFCAYYGPRLNLNKVRRNVWTFSVVVLSLYQTGQIPLAAQLAQKLEGTGEPSLPLVRAVGLYYARDFAGCRTALLSLPAMDGDQAPLFRAWAAYYLALLSEGEERTRYLEQAAAYPADSGFAKVAKDLLNREAASSAAGPQTAPVSAVKESEVQ